MTTLPPQHVPHNESHWPPVRLSSGVGEIRPIIAVDSREQDPLQFKHFPTIRATLQVGDYSYLGAEERFAVERKSISDLVACCMGKDRDRFKSQLRRLSGSKFARLIVVGSQEEIDKHQYRSAIEPRSVMHTLNAFEVRYNIAVVFVQRQRKPPSEWSLGVFGL